MRAAYLAPPSQAVCVKLLQVRSPGDQVVRQRDSAGARVGVDGPGRRAARHRRGPARADGVVQQDALKAMVRADGPLACRGECGEDLASEAEPLGFERGAVRVNHC